MVVGLLWYAQVVGGGCSVICLCLCLIAFVVWVDFGLFRFAIGACISVSCLVVCVSFGVG